MGRPRILVTFGTRPEAIKMFPVVNALKRSAFFETTVVVTAQHREMLDQVLQIAGIRPDLDLDLMRPSQSLDELAARIITEFGSALDRFEPDRVLVQGDTLTTMMAAMACYFRRIPVGHVEAGLRSGNIYAPWPEEVNRKVAGAIADLHFAPTERAAAALWREDVPRESIHVTGNTVIDALMHTRSHHVPIDPALKRLEDRLAGKRIITVTAHRRESFGEGMEQIAAALNNLAARPDVEIVFPLHPNPKVRGAMLDRLSGHPSIHLIEPLDYPSFVDLMAISDLILTDSGGVQEEAPSLSKPVLVMRNETERPEAIEAGVARLVGTEQHRITSEASRLLDDPLVYSQMAQAANPFGDGRAAERILAILKDAHNVSPGDTDSLSLTSTGLVKV